MNAARGLRTGALALLLALCALLSAPPARAELPGTPPDGTPEAPWSVLLRATSEVACDAIRIGDFADVEGDPAIGEVVVTWSPPVGTDRMIPRAAVAAALHGRFGRPISVGGASAARVRRRERGAPVIDEAELLRRAGETLLARRPDLRGAPLDLRVQVNAALLPAGRASVEIELSNVAGDRVSGRLLADYDRGFRRVATFTLEGETTVREWRAARFLKNGETVREGDAREVAVRCGLALRRAPFVGSPVGKRAKSSVREGAPLSNDLFGKAVCVKKGDKLILRSDNELICVEVQGVALEEGDTGDTIAVRNTKSGRTLRAIVRGPGEAVITGGR